MNTFRSSFNISPVQSLFAGFILLDYARKEHCRMPAGRCSLNTNINMRLSKSFALLPQEPKHVDSPAELKRRRSSIDSFVIPRRTRLPSSKQSHTDSTDLNIIDTLFNHKHHTPSEATQSTGIADICASPTKRRALFFTKSNKENNAPILSKSPSNHDDHTQAEDMRFNSMGATSGEVRESLFGLRGGDAHDTSRKTSSSYFSERPGSVRSAKEYNHLAQQYKLPRFDYKNYEQNCPEPTLPESKRQSFFGRLLSKRTSTRHLSSSSTTPALQRSRSNFNFMHIEGAYKDVLANRSLDEISRIGGLHTVKLPRDYAIETYAVPTVVSACIGYLLKHGMTAPGIFRISGQKTTINTLYTWYSNLCIADQHDQEVLRTLGNGALPNHINYNPHDVASLLKKVIFGLHGGLLGSVELFKTLYGALTNLERQPGQSEEDLIALKAQIIALLISSIPNAKQVHLICAFFGLTAAIGDETKRIKATDPSDENSKELMGHRALGVVFGPLLLSDLEADLDLGPDRFNADRPTAATSKMSKKEKRRSQVIDPKLQANIMHQQAILRVTAATELAYQLLSHWKAAIAELQRIERTRQEEYLNGRSPEGSIYTFSEALSTDPARDDKVEVEAPQLAPIEVSLLDKSRSARLRKLAETFRSSSKTDHAQQSTDHGFLKILKSQQKEAKKLLPPMHQPRMHHQVPTIRDSVFADHEDDADDELEVDPASDSKDAEDKVAAEVTPRPHREASDHSVHISERMSPEQPTQEGSPTPRPRRPSSVYDKPLPESPSRHKHTFSSFRNQYLDRPNSKDERTVSISTNTAVEAPLSRDRSSSGPNEGPDDPQRKISFLHSGYTPRTSDDLSSKCMGSPTSSQSPPATRFSRHRRGSSGQSSFWDPFSDVQSMPTSPELIPTVIEENERETSETGKEDDHVAPGHEIALEMSEQKTRVPSTLHSPPASTRKPSARVVSGPPSTPERNLEDLSMIHPTSQTSQPLDELSQLTLRTRASMEGAISRYYNNQNPSKTSLTQSKPMSRMNVFSRGSSSQAQTTTSREATIYPKLHVKRSRDTIAAAPIHASGEIIPAAERPRSTNFQKVKERWVSWSSSSGESASSLETHTGRGVDKRRALAPVEGVRDISLRALFEGGDEVDEKRQAIKAMVETDRVSRKDRPQSHGGSVMALAEKYLGSIAEAAEREAMSPVTQRQPSAIRRKPVPSIWAGTNQQNTDNADKDATTNNKNVYYKAPRLSSIAAPPVVKDLLSSPPRRTLSPTKPTKIPQPASVSSRHQARSTSQASSRSGSATPAPSTPRLRQKTSKRLSLFGLFANRSGGSLNKSQPSVGSEIARNPLTFEGSPHALAGTMDVISMDSSSKTQQASPIRKVIPESAVNLERITNTSPVSIMSSVAPEREEMRRLSALSLSPRRISGHRAVSGIGTATDYEYHEQVPVIQQRSTSSSCPSRRLPTDWIMGENVYHDQAQQSKSASKRNGMNTELLHRMARDIDALPCSFEFDDDETAMPPVIPMSKYHHQRNISTPSRSSTPTPLPRSATAQSPPMQPRESLDTRASSLDERTRIERRDAKAFRESMRLRMTSSQYISAVENEDTGDEGMVEVPPFPSPSPSPSPAGGMVTSNGQTRYRTKGHSRNNTRSISTIGNTPTPTTAATPVFTKEFEDATPSTPTTGKSTSNTSPLKKRRSTESNRSASSIPKPTPKQTPAQGSVSSAYSRRPSEEKSGGRRSKGEKKVERKREGEREVEKRMRQLGYLPGF